MEVKEKSKKRELIKTIAIVFLAVLMVLTFFSNTIMNRSLPEVATQAISSGTINAKIRGSGTVTANESYEVIINQTREVRSVCVQVGDIVSQGDLLFVLGDMESTELQNAQEQLDSLNLQYQQQLLTLSKEYAGDDLTVQRLREDLEKATAQRDANAVTDTDISYAKGDLAEAKNELSQITLILAELNDMMADNEEYQNAKAVVSELESKITTLQNTIAEYQSQLNEIDTSGSLDIARKLQDAQAAVDNAQRVLTSDWNTYKTTFEDLVKAVDCKYSGALNDYNNKNYIQLKSYIEAFLANYTVEDEKAGETGEGKEDGVTEKNFSEYSTAYHVLLSDQAALDTAQATADQLRQSLSDANNSVEAQRANIQSKLNQASRELSSAQYQLQQANYVLAQAESSNAALKEQIKTYESSQRQQNALIETLTQNVSDLEAKKALYDQAVELVAQQERAIEDALAGKNIDKQLDNLDLQALRDQIERAQELVDKYTQESVDTEVTANVSGLVSAINVSAGKETTSGAAMAVIDVVDQGYVIKIPVTNEQSKQVKVGDTANVTNYYWGNNVEAKLEAVTADPNNPGKGKLLVFRVTGEIDAGSNITLSIGQRSANYDTIIPKSALREDTNGYFVLVITVKSSPLSNRYIATRVDVQVLAEDDTSAAVSGLSAGDFVITTSSKPVEAGAQVRMVENS